MTRALLIASLLLSATAHADPFVIHEDVSATPDGSGNLMGGRFDLRFRNTTTGADLAVDEVGVPAEDVAARDAAVVAGDPYTLPEVLSYGHANGACAGDCLHAEGLRTAKPINDANLADLVDGDTVEAFRAYLVATGLKPKIAARLKVRTYVAVSYLDIDPDGSSARYAGGGTVRCRCVFNYLYDPKTGLVYAEICNNCLHLLTLA